MHTFISTVKFACVRVCELNHASTKEFIKVQTKCQKKNQNQNPVYDQSKPIVDKNKTNNISWSRSRFLERIKDYYIIYGHHNKRWYKTFWSTALNTFYFNRKEKSNENKTKPLTNYLWRCCRRHHRTTQHIHAYFNWSVISYNYSFAGVYIL